MLHVRLSADSCLAGSIDHASYGGRLYSDKAPGLSVLALPAVALVQLPTQSSWGVYLDLRLWVVRLLTCGIAFIACVFLVGRVAEGLAPGWGGAVLVTFALGTVISSLAISTFEEVPAATLGFAAFLLAWLRRPLVAGLAAGAAILVDYESSMVAVILALYVTLSGARAAGRYLLGLMPAVALLGAYDWAAFGSPVHLSYRYVTQQFASRQHQGLFGVGWPSLHGARLVFIGDRGLLVNAPVVTAAALGLALLWRRGLRAEAAVCAGVTVAFLDVDLSYFDPYGGDSPGPRFLIPALPFLALGLPFALARWRTLVTALVVVSVVASVAVLLTWTHTGSGASSYPGTIWRQISLFVENGRSAPIATWAPRNVIHWVGIADGIAGLLLVASAFTACAIGLLDGWTARPREPLKSPA